MSTLVGYDAAFGLNEFQQPKIMSEIEVVKNVFLTVLFGKRGQYPSLPMIGMDLGSRLYSQYDEIDCSNLSDEITEQCSALGVYLHANAIQIRKEKYRGQPSLLIQIRMVTCVIPRKLRMDIGSGLRMTTSTECCIACLPSDGGDE